MTMRDLELAVLAEARTVTQNPKLRLKDILEWTTGEIDPRDDEQIYQLPTLKVQIAVRKAVEP